MAKRTTKNRHLLYLFIFVLGFHLLNCKDPQITGQQQDSGVADRTGQAGTKDSEGGDSAQRPTPGDWVFFNGVVYTVDAKDSVHQALVIREKKIVYVGKNEQAKRYIGANTKSIDLKGKMVLPGFHDVHMHPLEAGSFAIPEECALHDEDTLKNHLATLKTCVKTKTAQVWALGFGHLLESILYTPKSPRLLLDELMPDRPVAIMEATSHSAWVNSKALALAKITKDTPNPQGGIIYKDKQKQPNGILLDNAGNQVFHKAFSNPDVSMLWAHHQGLLESLKKISQHGITSIVDARLYWKRGYLEVYDKVLKAGQLTARTQLSLWAYPGEKDSIQLQKLRTLYRKRKTPESLLWIDQIKLYSDGIIHNGTAALLKPYDTPMPQVPVNGIHYFSKERMAKYIQELEKVGFDFHIHAIGSKGVRAALNAIAQAMKTNGARERRHKLTHLELVSPPDRKRFKELGVIADFQLAGDFAKIENAHWSKHRIGERYKELLPIADIHATGAKITLSSDWDVSSLSPFVGIQNAVQRGKKGFTLKQALRAYTINGAYSMRQEQWTGSLEVGKLADVIVLDRDLLKTDTSNIKHTKVLLTLLAGRSVYRATEF